MGELDILNEEGFRLAGEWKIRGEGIVPEYLDGHVETKKHLLYAFGSDNVVRYIGQTLITLKERMQGYTHPGPSQDTNKRINQNIKDILNTPSSNGSNAVPIWIKPISSQFADLSSIEEKYISAFDTRNEEKGKWNRR